MSRAYYAASIDEFLAQPREAIVGQMVGASGFAIELTQRDAWLTQVDVLKASLSVRPIAGNVYFEYSIPRLGSRADVVALIGGVVFVLEFKVGASAFLAGAIEQVWDYALDIKNFHEPSHIIPIAPVLVVTAGAAPSEQAVSRDTDGVYRPILATPASLHAVIEDVLRMHSGALTNASEWEQGRYSPTPTIVEAAVAMYSGHGVEAIARCDAGATNLTLTARAISRVIERSKAEGRKSLCIVTGVPGAGKTLVGLDAATKHIDKENGLYSVFLSGNGPLVAILREALVRDRVQRERASSKRVTKGTALREVKLFIQNVHHFRDDCLLDPSREPLEHVALFDEAQRAWDLDQTTDFMRRKKGHPEFDQSEPEFLISCLDRHKDWATIVCLVGGGQEINRGEAGISGWIDALCKSFPDWSVYISPRITDSEYGAGQALDKLEGRPEVHHVDELHLSVSMRSFRAERVSDFVKCVLDLEVQSASALAREIVQRYPIVLTRSLASAKSWLRGRARGSERYGVVVSSQAMRLKPHAIDVRSPLNPIHWFLNGKDDVRSSYFLEDAATEFHVQGLEIDWACVVWDADLRLTKGAWQHHEFVGDRWQQVRKRERQMYLKNAYRVLLTRARQGMAIVVPEGDGRDATRRPEYYDSTFNYLASLGLPRI